MIKKHGEICQSQISQDFFEGFSKTICKNLTVGTLVMDVIEEHFYSFGNILPCKQTFKMLQNGLVISKKIIALSYVDVT